MAIIKPSTTRTAELTYRDYARELPDGVTFVSGNEFTVALDNKPFTVTLKPHGNATRPGSIRTRQSHRDVVVSMPVVRQLCPQWNEQWLTQMLKWTIRNVVHNRNAIVSQMNAWSDDIPFVLAKTNR